jgi:hypothetical protein
LGREKIYIMVPSDRKVIRNKDDYITHKRGRWRKGGLHIQKEDRITKGMKAK